MAQVATQVFETQHRIGYRTPKHIPEYPSRNGVEIVLEKEKNLPNSAKVLTREEEIRKSIADLTQYMEDLKAGRPVENMSPSNDPFFLNPEVIAGMIRGEQDRLAGRGTIVNSIEDIIGEWDI
jgi:hypothetical protein